MQNGGEYAEIVYFLVKHTEIRLQMQGV